jgi:hypothetical protein
MLNNGELIISECEGCGGAPMSEADAKVLARDLRKREEAEAAEAAGTADQYQKHSNISGATIIYDSRGAHKIDD